MDEHKSQSKTELSIPSAIIIAGLLIAAAVLITNSSGRNSQQADNAQEVNRIEPVKPTDINIKPVDNTDHIRGALAAPVKIVEFSDPECPFCKMFHSTMKQVIDVYAKNNQVAWVYRNFPLDALHPKARHESEALECAGELGGNDKFWSYLDRLMIVTPSNNQLDPTQLYEIANFVKLDAEKFKTCLDSGRYAKKIQADIDEAISAGGSGTPYSVIISSTGKKYPVDGALPYATLKTMIDTALQDK